MADTVIRGERRLESTLLGPGKSADPVKFVPLEGVIAVRASGIELLETKIGTGSSTGIGVKGKVESDPHSHTGGFRITRSVDVEVTLYPPKGTGSGKSKVFRARDLDKLTLPASLEMGVRPEQAGKPWTCRFRNVDSTTAEISGTVSFVKERRPAKPPPPVVSVDQDAASPVLFLGAGGSVQKEFPFAPAQGTIEVQAFALEIEVHSVVGKVDPRSENDLGFEIRQNVHMQVELLDPSGAKAAAAEFRSRRVVAEAAKQPQPLIEHVVPPELADQVWRCRLSNLGDSDIEGGVLVTFPVRRQRTDLPLRLLNNGLRQLVAGVGLTVRLDGKTAFIGVSRELESFAENALGGSLRLRVDADVGHISAEFHDVNLITAGLWATTDRGEPVISAVTRFEARGVEIDKLELLGLDLGDVDIGRLAIQVDITLATTRTIDRTSLFPVADIKVDTQALVKSLLPFDIDITEDVVSTIEKKIRELTDSATFRSMVGEYVTAGLIELVQQGHEFQGLMVDSDNWVVLHSDPHPDAPPLPEQPPHLAFPRGETAPAVLSEKDRARLDKIDSVVVLMQENRSFDHLLGYLSHPDYGLPLLQSNRSRDIPDGLTGAESNLPSARGLLVHVKAYPTGFVKITSSRSVPATAMPITPHHEHDHVLAQVNEGKMDGFVADLEERFPSFDPQFFMSFYTGEHLPVYDALAAQYAICDRWFCSHPGPTQPNRFCTLSGHMPELENFELDDPVLAYLRMPTLFDTLTDAGVDWVYYEGDIGFLRLYDRYRLDNEHVIPFDDPVSGFLRRAELGTLPPVTFIDPNFTDVPPAATANDDHPPADLVLGQSLVQRVHDALVASPRWVNGAGGTLLVITYDEHGGFYDHVPPPGTPLSTEPDPVPLVHPEGKGFYGVRVPAFVVSPFVRPGRVSHTTFDHTSIMATILRRFVGEIPPEFGPRPSVAQTLAGLLTLDRPRFPLPFGRRLAAGANPRFRDTRIARGDFRTAMRTLAQPSRL